MYRASYEVATYSRVLPQNLHRESPINVRTSRDGAGGVVAAICVDTHPRKLNASNVSQSLDFQLRSILA